MADPIDREIVERLLIAAAPEQSAALRDLRSKYDPSFFIDADCAAIVLKPGKMEDMSAIRPYDTTGCSHSLAGGVRSLRSDDNGRAVTERPVIPSTPPSALLPPACRDRPTLGE